MWQVITNSMKNMANNSLFRKKNVNFIRDVTSHTKLQKTLGPMDLLFIGLGAVIGTGIFVLTGVNAAVAAGPAVVISFAVAGITCVFVALVYTEVAASLPSSGGSYTYVYVGIGELAAWFVGWCLTMQLLFGSTAVASGWSGYVLGILNQLNIHIPDMLTKTPFEGGIMDLPAFLICLVLMCVVYRGTQESSWLNIILVIVKLGAIALFLIMGFGHFEIANWGNTTAEFMPFGIKGVVLASGSLFLAYTGFDVVANATEESKNPERDVTIGLIASILIAMVLYVLVSGLLTGIAYYADLNNKEPLAYALKIHGHPISGTLIAVGGIVGMTTVILVQTYGLSRVLMAMSRDGLIPAAFNKIHKKYSTPYVGTIVAGTAMAFISGFIPIKIMGDLASLSTLVVLMFVTVSAMILRRTKPTIKRPFRCPALPLVATIGLGLCGYLSISLLSSVGTIFASSIILGFLVFFLYSRKRANRVYASNH
jgi:basic amino acid/polyamine antiporter, APA family